MAELHPKSHKYIYAIELPNVYVDLVISIYLYNTVKATMLVADAINANIVFCLSSNPIFV